MKRIYNKFLKQLIAFYIKIWKINNFVLINYKVNETNIYMKSSRFYFNLRPKSFNNRNCSQKFINKKNKR